MPEMTPALRQLLQEELANPDLDTYTVAVLARRDLERGEPLSALSRLQVECDKVRCVSPVLSQAVTRWFEERAAAQAQWTRSVSTPSPTERIWQLS